MKTIASIEDIRDLGRPIGDVKREKLMAFINEAEQTQIKPSIGDELYLAMLNPENMDVEKYRVLRTGGEYTDKNGCPRYFAGLLVTISYFVYVKTLMSGDIESTRFGFVQKDSQYSSHISDAARSAAYNEAMEVASCYLRDCIEYCKVSGLIKTQAQRKPASMGGCFIKKIG